MRLKPLLFLSCLALSSLCALPAQAHLRNYLVNYGYYTLPKGRAEVELWTDYHRPKTSLSSADYWSHQTEVEYGVTDRYTLGLYAVFVEPLGYTAFKMENRYRFAELGEWPVDTAAYLELKKANHRDDENEVEAKLILNKDFDNLNLVANGVLEYEEEIEPNGEKEWELEPPFFTLGAAYPLGRVTPGLEAVVKPSASQLIPGLYIDITPDIRLNLGVAFGLGDKAEDQVLKSVLELEF